MHLPMMPSPTFKIMQDGLLSLSEQIDGLRLPTQSHNSKNEFDAS
jgi:hypothetical protein